MNGMSLPSRTVVPCNKVRSAVLWRRHTDACSGCGYIVNHRKPVAIMKPQHANFLEVWRRNPSMRLHLRARMGRASLHTELCPHREQRLVIDVISASV